MNSLVGFSLEKAVNFQPIHESIKPSITRSVRISKPETVTTILVKVKLDRYTRFKPGFNYSKLTAEKKIIRGNCSEHRRSILRYFYCAHSAINRTDESKFHCI